MDLDVFFHAIQRFAPKKNGAAVELDGLCSPKCPCSQTASSLSWCTIWGSLSSEKLFLSLTEFPQKPQWIVEPRDHRKKQTRFLGLNTAQMGYPTHGSIDGIPAIHIQWSSAQMEPIPLPSHWESKEVVHSLGWGSAGLLLNYVKYVCMIYLPVCTVVFTIKITSLYIYIYIYRHYK